MDLNIIGAVRPILLVGCGYMGRIYLRILHDLGFLPREITVWDRNPATLDSCRANFPDVQIADSLEIALAARPKTLLNITNSPEHGKVMQAAVDAGVLFHFVEKPILLPHDLAPVHAFPKGMKVGVGYLINFSPAMNKLFELMRAADLVVKEGRGFWGKDRTADSRPTAGDLEDEATHPLATLLSAVEFNQGITLIEVRATLSFLRFVNQEVQESARRQDASYPQIPTSTSHLALRLRGPQPSDIILTVASSFVSFGQERRIEFALGQLDNEQITHLVRVDFDENGQDIFSLRRTGSKMESERIAFPGKDKLRDQLTAFFHYAAGAEKDPRLTDLRQALMMVKISKTALDSDLLRSAML